MKYQVVVGNLGTVYDGDDFSVAINDYNVYVKLSDGEIGRAAGETVTLFEDDEPTREHFPTVLGYDCPDCETTMENIGDNIMFCPDCSYETGKDSLDKDMLFDVAVKCQKALIPTNLSNIVRDEIREELRKVIKMTARK